MVDEEMLDKAIEKLVKGHSDAGTDEEILELVEIVRVNLLERFRPLCLTDPLFAIGWAQLAGLLNSIERKAN